jgi:cephalosporin hydroxylase
MSEEVYRHDDTWLELNELGKFSRPYRPTFRTFSESINRSHAYYHVCPTKGICIDVGIPGWLRREDALKLYELAYFADGDILELGTSRGLSTSIMALAVQDSGTNRAILSVDINKAYSEQARRYLTDLNLQKAVTLSVGDGGEVCAKLLSEERKFAVAFIDHSHAYEHVAQVCEFLPDLVSSGGFCLFHDFNDRRNTDRVSVGESGNEYGVYHAVRRHLDPRQFEFYGVYGCCGLFRRI